MTLSALSPQRLCGIFLAALCLSILGCNANVPSTTPVPGGQLRGALHGGQQPISGASVQLYAVGRTGYGSSATPLLSSPVMTDATGAFSITGDYTCPTSTSQLYIVATGGNPGLAPGTNNPAIAMMSALGPCTLHGGQLTLDPNELHLDQRSDDGGVGVFAGRALWPEMRRIWGRAIPMRLGWRTHLGW